MQVKDMELLIGCRVPYELIVLQARYDMFDKQTRTNRLHYRDAYGMEHVEAVIGHLASKAKGHIICEVHEIEYDIMRLLLTRFAPTLVTINSANRMHAIVGCSPDLRGAGVAIYCWEESQPSTGCPLYITHPNILLDMPPLSRGFVEMWLTAIDKHIIKR